MKNINYDKSLLEQARNGEFKVFDFYGNHLRYTAKNGWQVEYSVYEGERKLFRPEILDKTVWEKYDTDMGIYVK